MGNSSSQLAFTTDKVDGDGVGDGAFNESEMSSAHGYDAYGAAPQRSFGPRMSPLPGEDDDGLSETKPPNPSSKKKQKKRRKSIDDKVSHEQDPEPVNEDGYSNKDHTIKSKKKSRKKSAKQEVPLAEVDSTQAEAQDTGAEEVDESPKRKSKKKSKKNATRAFDVNDDHDAPEPVGSSAHADQAPSASDPQHSSIKQEVSPPGKQKKIQHEKHNGRQAPGAEPQFVAPPRTDSPPSAQVPMVNGSFANGHGAEDGAGEPTMNPSSPPTTKRRPSTQSQASTLSASQIKTEAPGEDDELPIQRIYSPTVNLRLANGRASEDIEWLHKGDEQLNGALTTNTRDAYPGTADEMLPDLLPSQIKPERPSDTDTDSDAPSISGSKPESPSAARADRLDQSRSRSGSKAPSFREAGQRLAEETLGLDSPETSQPSGEKSNKSESRISTPYSGPSSGSDHSISPQVASQATSLPGEPAEQISSNGPHADNDVLGSTNSVANTQSQSAEEQSRGVGSNDGRTNDSEGNVQKPVLTSLQASPSKTRKRVKSATTKLSMPQSHSAEYDRDTQLMADWLEGKEQRNQDPRPATLHEDAAPHSSEQRNVADGSGNAPESKAYLSQLKPTSKGSVNGLLAERLQQQELGGADGIPGASPDALPAKVPQSSTKKRRPKSSYLETEAIVNPQEAVTTAASPTENEKAQNCNIEPGESASQPQSKAKRKRKLQPKTSITLSQLEGGDPGEGESPLPAFSQRSKRKDAMRGDSNEADRSEVGVSREPSVQSQQPRKVRKKRRTENRASDDEMESLLAAGPSKSRKRGSGMDFSDGADARAAKRKRLSKASSAASNGPWTAEELEIIEKVYEDFRDANDMTAQQLNAMIHERPDRSNELHQEFWNRADVAVPQRTRKQIVERTRRLFNNFTARGTWTDEQKEELHELFETHGKKFSHIAGLINRDQRDIRDYWRDHYLVWETQIKRRWSEEEEAHLTEVVEEALAKIRIQRANSDGSFTRPRAAGDDDHSLLDWHQISVAMDSTRSRRQCKWKWTDMREKGLVGEGSRPPTQASERRLVDTSDELFQARQDLANMTDEDKKRLIEAIHVCGAMDDARIPWPRLVNNQFRAKWTRLTLKLAWFRLRRSVPDYELNTVEDNARYLLNHKINFEDFPLFREGHIDDLAEEKLIHTPHGARRWKRVSQDPRAIAERQRRAAKTQENAQSNKDVVHRWLRDNSVDLGDDGNHDVGDDETGDEGDLPRNRQDVPIQVPKHLKGEAAKKALAEARAKANSQGSKKGKGLARSASIAIDSESE